ncbi:alpha/beta hydrolase [Neobacillus citreus]
MNYLYTIFRKIGHINYNYREALLMKSPSLFNRINIEFNAEGAMLRGWLYTPNTSEENFPAIIMSHGYGSLKEMYLDAFAEHFANNGFAVLVYDHRNFGDSDGFPRQEINPYEQVLDFQHAITFICTLKEIDRSRIGIWGTSYSGGHVLQVAAMDKRISCVVAQVPTVSGSQAALRRVQPDEVPTLLNTFYDDRENRMLGGKPAYKKIVAETTDEQGIYQNEEAVKWYLKAGKRSPNWRNEVTIRSIDLSRSYEPGKYFSMISPTPLLILVAADDIVTPTDLTLAAYEEAREPKKLVIIDGHHFTPYIEKFDIYSNEALKWFTQHLKKDFSSTIPAMK